MEEAYKAIKIISRICAQNEHCTTCPYQICEKCGIITQGYPSYWAIKDNPKIEFFD